MTECLSQWLSRADNVDIRGGANLDSLSDALVRNNSIIMYTCQSILILIDILLLVCGYLIHTCGYDVI